MEVTKGMGTKIKSSLRKVGRLESIVIENGQISIMKRWYSGLVRRNEKRLNFIDW